MRAIEGTWCNIVEAVVIDTRQPVGPIRLGPDPALEGVLDLLQFGLGRLRIDDVEHPPFAVAVLEGVEDLRDAAVQRIGEKLAGMAAIRAPFRRASRHPSELAGLHGPRRQFRHVADLDFGIHRLLDEGDDIGGRNPGCAEPCGDVGRLQIGRLHALQRGDVSLKGRVECSRGLRHLEPVADRTGEISIGYLPGAIGRIAEDRAAEFGDDILVIAVQQLGDVVDIDPAALVEHHGEGIGGAGDQRRRRRRDHAFGEDRAGLRRIGLEIVILDGGDQPAIGIVEEWLNVGSAMRLTHLAGFLVLRQRDRGKVDRAEVAHETRPRDAQFDLRILPRPVEFLSFEDLAHSVPDRDQLADDADVFFGDAICAATLANLDRNPLAVEDLHRAPGLVEEIAALANMPVGRNVRCRRVGDPLEIGIDHTGLAVVDRFRKDGHGGGECGAEILALARLAGVGFPERA